MNKTKLKSVLAFIAFLLVCILLYVYCSMIFTPKDITQSGGFNYFRKFSIDKEEENSIDLLVMGNSDCYNGFSPMQLYKDKGYASFTCGVSKQNVGGVKSQLTRILKKQTPKLVILEADTFYSKTNKNSFRTDFEFSPLNILFSPIAYHARWKELTVKDFIKFPTAQKDFCRGYVVAKETTDYTVREDYMKNLNVAPTPMDKDVVSQIKQIKSICDKNEIEIFFMCLPTPFSWEEGKYVAVKNLAEEMGVDYLDLNLPISDFEFDYSKYFKDNGNHLNLAGATYVTKYVGNYIESKYDLPDRRSDEKYASWNEDLAKYDSFIA